jgi:hypothetical protein
LLKLATFFGKVRLSGAMLRAEPFFGKPIDFANCAPFVRQALWGACAACPNNLREGSLTSKSR